MRLIDADAIPPVSADPYEEEQFRDTIDSMPTITAEPKLTDDIIAAHEKIGYEKGRADGYAEALEAEPKHGRWIFGETRGHSWMKCSECCVSQSGQTATFTYCPNCGARMDGGENDTL